MLTEVNVIPGSTDAATGFIDYAPLATGGFIGTFGVQTSGLTNLNFYPSAGINTNCGVKVVDYQLNKGTTGVGTTTMVESMMGSFYTSISASATPGENKICGFTSTEYELSLIHI